MRNWRRTLILTAPFLLLTVVGFRHLTPRQSAGNGQYGDSLLAGLEWRNVGPLRGGRAYAVAGNASQPDTFYFGSAGGGVWKTTDAGRTWEPISDTGIPIGSIGAIAVAPSNPNIVYVGTGEPDIRSQHSYGIGMFKSTDAGKTWAAIGLADSSQIGRIVVDPANPERVYVAALGSPYESNATRGVYRSTDGGATWKQVLRNADRPNDVGAVDLAIDMRNPKVLYASMWSTRRPPWSVYAPSNLPGGGLYKSIDGGDHWTHLGGGLPTDNFVGKIGIAIAPSNPNRLWASVDDLGAPSPTRGPGGGGGTAAAPSTGGGIYASDDAGLHWRLVNREERLWGRGWYFEQLAVDPVNPDKVYVINTATFVTTDGGKHFLPLKGSPGGDDYHQLWINPRDGNRMVLSSDQGTVVSVDDGKTWSSWYNQSTAQIYHLSADNRYPYWLYGPQQDSGAASAAVASTRENVITFRDWLPICAGGESNSVVPDPKDPAILYSRMTSCNQFRGGRGGGGGGRGGGVAADATDPARKTWTLPTVLSAADGALYTSDQFLYRSRDGAHTWEKISPDLSRVNPAIPANLDPLTAKDMDEPMTGLGPNHDENRYGVIYTISPSPLNAPTIWAGTDDGSIQVTRDGGANWENVTPPELTAWSKISQIDAGHFDASTAYASVDRHRLGDRKAYIYRTNDGGKTWQLISKGIPDGAFVNSIKEDPVQKGLLYAATELRVYVSFDDGAHWQSLQNNMPVVSVRDVIAHDNDLDIATFGRGFYVLDNMAPLRQIAQRGSEIAAASAYLFAPADSYAGGGGGGGGTPLPKDETQLPNPPTGVVVYYWLQHAANGPLKIELVGSNGRVSACAASDAPVVEPNPDTANVQLIWMQPAQPPSAEAGMHRFALGASAGRGAGGGRRGGGTPVRDACSSPAGAAPSAAAGGGRGRGGAGGRGAAGPATGAFTVRLTVDGQTYDQPVTIKSEPQTSFAGVVENPGGNE
ncbi:MAG TPA: hypothetical protein VN709_07910 [Terriglobales bacterium]|nr:hypothetical protein [Terriglobales bacterium]